MRIKYNFIANLQTEVINKTTCNFKCLLFTDFSNPLGLTVEKSGIFLPFPNGVEVNGPGNDHDKRHECEKV